MFDYLPLGSVVLLKGGTQKILIIARALKVLNNNEEYFFDYGGVIYPEGLVGDQIAYFNGEQISKVVFEGYSDIDNENMIENIKSFISENNLEQARKNASKLFKKTEE